MCGWLFAAYRALNIHTISPGQWTEWAVSYASCSGSRSGVYCEQRSCTEGTNVEWKEKRSIQSAIHLTYTRMIVGFNANIICYVILCLLSISYKKSNQTKTAILLALSSPSISCVYRMPVFILDGYSIHLLATALTSFFWEIFSGIICLLPRWQQW